MERRFAPRMLCAELVEVEWKDKAGRRRRNVANLEDISLAGACVQLDRTIPLGTKIVMRYGGGQLSAVVQYCFYRDHSYFVGVEFPESSRWSPARFRPQHMLDPRELTQPAKRHRKEARPDCTCCKDVRAGATPQEERTDHSGKPGSSTR